MATVLRVLGADGGTRNTGLAIVDHVTPGPGEDFAPRRILRALHLSHQEINHDLKNVRVVLDNHRRRRAHASQLVTFLDNWKPHALACEGYQGFQREFSTQAGSQRRVISSDSSAMIVGVIVGVCVARGLETMEIMSAELAPLLWPAYRVFAATAAKKAKGSARQDWYRVATSKRPPKLDKEDRIRIACSMVEKARAAIWEEPRPEGWQHLGDALTHALVFPFAKERNTRDLRVLPEQYALL